MSKRKVEVIESEDDSDYCEEGDSDEDRREEEETREFEEKHGIVRKSNMKAELEEAEEDEEIVYNIRGDYMINGGTKIPFEASYDRSEPTPFKQIVEMFKNDVKMMSDPGAKVDLIITYRSVYSQWIPRKTKKL